MSTLVPLEEVPVVEVIPSHSCDNYQKIINKQNETEQTKTKAKAPKVTS
jgi:hypothetical protein